MKKVDYLYQNQQTHFALYEPKTRILTLFYSAHCNGLQTAFRKLRSLSKSCSSELKLQYYKFMRVIKSSAKSYSQLVELRTHRHVGVTSYHRSNVMQFYTIIRIFLSGETCNGKYKVVFVSVLV